METLLPCCLLLCLQHVYESIMMLLCSVWGSTHLDLDLPMLDAAASGTFLYQEQELLFLVSLVDELKKSRSAARMASLKQEERGELY